MRHSETTFAAFFTGLATYGTLNLQLLTETRPFDSCGGFVAAVVTSVEFDQFGASRRKS